MRLGLDTNWRLVHRPLDWTAEQAAAVLAADDWLDAGDLPCDVHLPLIRAGIIQDPVVADHCYDAEWMERCSWWLRRDFTLTAADLEAREARLVLESLDLLADIFINGVAVGRHTSAHYPFSCDVRRWLRAGSNSLLVRLTAGAEAISPAELDYLSDYVSTERDGGRGDRGEKARAMLRKPQYVYGWDWGPRVATIGIMKGAWLELRGDLAVTRLQAVTLAIEPDPVVRFTVEYDSLLPISTQEVRVAVAVHFEGEVIWSDERSVLAVSGVNYEDFTATLPGAKLWWPNGAGEQPLYELTATVTGATTTVESEPLGFGIRTVALDMAPDMAGGRRFAIQVNGVSLFAKGANWIPTDSIYARTDDAKYETLIREAARCNFNMLRIWGGGNYERDIFYDLCDRYGILIWHDFMFACALYPDDQAWFRELVRAEIDYQTKRLRSHPSLALWCGNNENQSIYQGVLGSGDPALPTGGLQIYNYMAPQIVRANCPEIPYWRSSPYGGVRPDDNEIGDRHHWGDCTMNADMEKRITPEEYDLVTSRFVSEYGYIGPCSEETIRRYYGDRPYAPGDAIWELHNNTFEKATVPAGIRKHYCEPDGLDTRNYLQYARLVQALMYGYSLEAIRNYPHCDGALFWMYTDTWGEVGWTIIDYYLDRKPAWYAVKRAFAPLKLILRRAGGTVRVTGINDTAADVTIALEYGYVSFDGVYDSRVQEVELKPFSRRVVLEFELCGDWDLRRGVVFARGGDAPLALLRTGCFCDYEAAPSEVRITGVEEDGADLLVHLKSSGYAHAVSLDLPAAVRLDDAWFDLLPGERRSIRILDGAGRWRAEELRPVWLSPGGVG